jgi:hypothetical protein
MFGFGKGKIDIKVNSLNHAPGDTITGTVTLLLKKPQQSKGVNIGLMAEEKRVSMGNNRSRTTVRVFDFKQPLDSEKEYPAGKELSYPFKIKVPTGSEMPKGALGGVLKAAQMLSGTGMRRWYLVANLDVKGFDVSKKLQINVG